MSVLGELVKLVVFFLFFLTNFLISTKFVQKIETLLTNLTSYLQVIKSICTKPMICEKLSGLYSLLDKNNKILKGEIMLEKFFKLKENNTTVRTEVVAGITTFMTMAYILAVNPLILKDAGMNPDGVFVASAITAALATFIMALYAKHPFALAPGMGLNAFFTYTVVLDYGFTWQEALFAVMIEGIIFILLSFLNVREAIFNSIPLALKNAVSAGIGLFIALIGLANAGIVTNEKATIIAVNDITQAGPLLAIIGILITGYLVAKNVKGAMLIGIIITTLIGIPMGVTVIPENFQIINIPKGFGDVAFKLQAPANFFSGKLLLAVFSFLFVDIFDTVGTLAGVATKANMLDEDGKLPRVGKALLADAVGTTAGAILGTSTVTTFVESSAGVAEGGRTGLTSLTTGVLFLIALVFSPLFGLIPAQATTPALVIVGMFMMGSVAKIDWTDFTIAVPAFLTIIMMPFGYSIAEGIVFGMVSYTVLHLLTGKKKDVSTLMIIVSVLLLLKYIAPYLI